MRRRDEPDFSLLVFWPIQDWNADKRKLSWGAKLVAGVSKDLLAPKPANS